MKKYLLVVFVIVLSAIVLSVNVFASDVNRTRLEAEELAKMSLAAHGGQSFKDMKSLIVRGKVDVTVSSFNQTIPATFTTIFSGEKYLLEINNPFQPFKQVFDGVETHTSVQRGFTFPPLNRLGLPLLQHLGDDGFIVSALAKKKKVGFRITSPEGYYTDFYLNKKTHKVKAYDSSYVVSGRDVTTSVEISKYEEKDGISIPKKYAQRFDIAQMTIYAAFKAKEIILNKEIDDDVFTLK